MFCENCGMQNEEGVAFCQNCGAPMGNAAQTPEEPMAPVAPTKKSPLPLIIGGVVVVAVVILLVVLLGGGGYKKTVSKYFEAFEKADAKALMELTLPEDIEEDYFEEMEEYTEMDKDEYIDKMSENLEEYVEEMEDFEWEIKNAESLKKIDKMEDDLEENFDISDFDDFVDEMDEYYEDYDFDADKIKDAYIVEVKIKGEFDGDTESEKIYDIVYKYKGKWYLLNGFDIF